MKKHVKSLAALSLLALGAASASAEHGPSIFDKDFKCRDGVKAPYEPVPYHFEASGEAIFLMRDGGNRVFLADESSAAGQVFQVLSSKTDDFSIRTGFKVNVSCRLSDTCDIQGSFFSVQQFLASDAITRQDPVNNFLFSPYLFVGANGQFISYDYESKIYNLELNARYNTRLSDDWTTRFIGGFRYIHIEEKFQLYGQELVQNAELTTSNTHNNLIMLQIGMEMEHAFGKYFDLGVSAKTGLGVNSAGNHITNILTSFPLPTDTRVDETTNNAALCGIIEVGAFGRLYITDCVSIRGGYNVMFLSGLALAPEQLDLTNGDIAAAQTAAGRTGHGLNTGGSMVLHGPTAGLEVRW
jgi:hypothetical protein